jgi:hypothetical protein
MESLDIDLIFNDIYEEQKQARYCELVGHTNEQLYVPAKQWNERLFQCVVKQGKEQEEFNCPSYGENNLKYVTSESFTNDDPATCYMKWGETCVICFDPITNQNNAYLTECKHAMHKTCITSLWNNTCFSALGFKCPICRASIAKCIWLQPRYMLEPWRFPYRKKPRCNLDFESQRELFNEEIITCKGCQCTKGCYGYVGSNLTCKACQKWRHFTFKDLQHNNCKCSTDDNSETTKNRFRNCNMFSTIYNMFWGS